MSTTSKQCRKCGETKPLEEFHKNRAAKDGRHVTCRVCKSTYMRSYYQQNRAERMAHDQRYREENRDKVAAATRRWYAANRDAALLYANWYREENRDTLRAYGRQYSRTANHLVGKARYREGQRGVPVECRLPYDEWVDAIQRELDHGSWADLFSYGSGKVHAWSPTLSRLNHRLPTYTNNFVVEPMFVNVRRSEDGSLPTAFYIGMDVSLVRRLRHEPLRLGEPHPRLIVPPRTLLLLPPPERTV